MYMMAFAVHLIANAVNPSEAPELHDGICTDMQYTCWQMQYSQVRLLMHVMRYVVHLRTNVVTP